MHLARSITVIACICFFAKLSFAGNIISTEYKVPATAIEQAVEAKLKASGTVDLVVEFINETFRLSEPLKIVFGGEEGPLYDRGSNGIYIPYSFIQEVKARFVAARYSETALSADDAAMDALMHTLFHELAHALIFMHELPVVGKEEDCSDMLANVLLIEFFEEGQEIAISAAELFNMESEDVEEFHEEDFWDEHSLDVQRYYSTLCHVYGSNPVKYAYIMKQANFTEERAKLCVDEYESIANNWLVLLAPYTKHDRKAGSL